MHLSEINIYPIKSCKAISLSEAKITRRGLEYDRRWMLVDQRNWFVTQREYPKLATIGVAVTADGLRATSEGGDRMEIPLRADSPSIAAVRIWKNRVLAEVYRDEINQWFSDVIGAHLRLVYMPDTTMRLAHAPYKIHPDDIVSFADGYPFLLLSEASVEDLTLRLRSVASKADGSVVPAGNQPHPGTPASAVPAPMTRFRPNFVVAGTEPYAEDTWRRFRIGKNVFYGVKRCGRCVMTTIDQDNGVKTGPDPLKTIASYRTIKIGAKKGARFGQNLIAEREGGIVRIGDTVRVLE